MARNRECPTLYGKRVTLEPLTAAHAGALYPLLADEELWRYTDAHAPRTLDTLRERYRRLEARRSADGTQLWLNWAVALPECGPVGFVQATVFKGLAKAEIAYVIGKRFWSLGLGTEAVSVLLAFLHNELDVRFAVATVDARNAASLRVLEKLGFRVVSGTDRGDLRLELAL